MSEFDQAIQSLRPKQARVCCDALGIRVEPHSELCELRKAVACAVRQAEESIQGPNEDKALVARLKQLLAGPRRAPPAPKSTGPGPRGTLLSPESMEPGMRAKLRELGLRVPAEGGSA